MHPTLLVADGDAELCDLYQRFLSAHGYVVETSPHGLDCMKKLRQRTPAAVVLDLELLWGGGDGVLAWLREESPTHAIPVILTATAARPDEFAEQIELGVVDYLAKPFTLTVLLETVRSVVARNAQRLASNPRRIFSELFIG